MTEVTADAPIATQPAPSNLGLAETKVLAHLERSINTEQEIPPIRQMRAQKMSAYIHDHAQAYLEKTTPEEKPHLEKKLQEVSAYFSSPDKDLGMSPFERMAQIYEHLEEPTNPAEKEVFDKALEVHMKELATRAFDQHYENPEQYVSHGFDHSIRVANYSNQIIENFPNIIDSIAKEYNLSPGGAKFIVENAALFHDCGYCSLAEGSTKVAHSFGSLRIIANKQLQEHTKHLLLAGKNDPGELKHDLLMHDLEGAVLFHNADKVEKGYDTKMLTTRGEWLGLADEEDVVRVISHFEESGKDHPEYDWFKLPDVVIRVKSEDVKNRVEAKLQEVYTARGFNMEDIPKVVWDDPKISTPLPDHLLYHGRKTDLKPGDKSLGLEYKEADTLGYSLLALLRVGDNLDMMPDRFSDIQRTPAFAEVYRTLYGRDDLRDPQVKRTLIDQVLDKNTQLSPKEREKIQEIGILLDGETFKHFGGCEAVRSVSFRPSSADTTQAEIIIHVDKGEFENLQKFTFKEKVKGQNDEIDEIDMNIAEYQLWRLQEAVKVNLHGGKPIQIRILGEDGNDLTPNTFLHN